VLGAQRQSNFSAYIFTFEVIHVLKNAAESVQKIIPIAMKHIKALAKRK
jgi:hypothetical protein